MRRKWLPDNVTSYKDRHGKTRYRFRKTGLPVYHFRNPPGTEGFREEYRQACEAVAEKLPRFAPFTYDALIADYYQSTRWTDMKASSQNTYRGIIEKFREKNGSTDVRRVTAGSIEKLLARRSDTPAAANNLRKTLARLHRHAIKLDWRKDNPVEATDAFKIKTDGFYTWTEDDLAAYDACWPIGTKERLAKELLLRTALRRSDAILVGRGHREGDKLRLHHSKNDSDTVISMGLELIEAIDACDSGHMTYLTTMYGKPYTSTGFYNWFKRACVKAGIPHCGPHGLRKAMSRRLAESNVTTLQGRSVTGHKTDAMFSRYAEKANKEDLSDEAMANLDRKFAKKEKRNAQ